MRKAQNECRNDDNNVEAPKHHNEEKDKEIPKSTGRKELANTRDGREEGKKGQR